MGPQFTARAHTNIALIKYWGKKDQDLIIPMNSSLSLTLDHFYTDTMVSFDSDLSHDIFSLNGKFIDDPHITQFMDLIRQKAHIKTFAHIDSTNHVPSTAGLASSASSYAALAASASKAAGLNLSHKDLSRLARRGSGSACRSIYGGFVEWRKGTNDKTSFAIPLEEHLNWNICMIVALVNTHKKKISSRVGMQRVVATSPYYEGWLKSTATDLINIKKAIQRRDFQMLGEITESNALKMHALNLSATPHFNYFDPLSLALMNTVEHLRTAQHIQCYYTLDAGPNVKILCKENDVATIKKVLTSQFPTVKLVTARPGEGIKFI